MQHLLSAWAMHSAYTDLPRSLMKRLRDAGFGGITVKLVPQINTYFIRNYSYHLATLIGLYAQGQGKVEKEVVELWLREFADLSERGEYFFCLNQFLFWVEKAG